MNNWYYAAGRALFGSAEAAAYWWPVLGAAFVVVLIVALGLLSGLYRVKPEKLSDEELLPPPRFGLVAFFELMWSIVSSTLGSVIGKHWDHYATLLGGTFFFIVICNLSGLVPGFAPATEQMNTTLAMALIIFVAFNYIGLKHGGVDYIKHLAGPMIWLAPLMMPIEIISLLARPVSLSLRLFGNISGDHLVFNVFSTLMRNASIPFVPVPAGILVFGTLVAVLQAFIFMTLSAVYVRLSLDTAHHH
jgi:F-type H+-transporting ATPase subunit a